MNPSSMIKMTTTQSTIRAIKLGHCLRLLVLPPRLCIERRSDEAAGECGERSLSSWSLERSSVARRGVFSLSTSRSSLRSEFRDLVDVGREVGMVEYAAWADVDESAMSGVYMMRKRADLAQRHPSNANERLGGGNELWGKAKRDGGSESSQRCGCETRRTIHDDCLAHPAPPVGLQLRNWSELLPPNKIFDGCG